MREIGATAIRFLAIGVAGRPGTRQRSADRRRTAAWIMHSRELETLRRHGVRIFICVLNDGAYGAEVHKLRQDGLDAQRRDLGRTDFVAIACGFGLRGATVAGPPAT